VKSFCVSASLACGAIGLCATAVTAQTKKGDELKNSANAVYVALPERVSHPTSPTNDAPNPYRTIENWATLPDGLPWGSTSAVAIDKDGSSIWVAERCGANSCLGSTRPTVFKFDSSGKPLLSFGAGMMIFPHGIQVDNDGNIWVTDGQDNLPRRARGAAADAPTPVAPAKIIGHQIFKFSPKGELLMTLGQAGGAKGDKFFYQPNNLLFLPNGDFYVVEGHSSAETANARLLKFDKTGKLLKTWGTLKGSGVGEFDQPHALAMDSQGRLFVGDRSNNRVLIYDRNMNLVDTWLQFSRPSGMFIDKHDTLYVADSESGSVNPAHGAWTRGIRVGSVRDGKVVAFIPDTNTKATNTSSAEGIAVNARGVIYGAEVGQRDLKKYVRK
jgi:streptogramin lyase